MLLVRILSCFVLMLACMDAHSGLQIIRDPELNFDSFFVFEEGRRIYLSESVASDLCFEKLSQDLSYSYPTGWDFDDFERRLATTEQYIVLRSNKLPISAIELWPIGEVISRPAVLLPIEFAQPLSNGFFKIDSSVNIETYRMYQEGLYRPWASYDVPTCN